MLVLLVLVLRFLVVLFGIADGGADGAALVLLVAVVRSSTYGLSRLP